MTVSLPEHRVDVVEVGACAQPHWIRCEIGENLQFDTEVLEAYCLANRDARVYDAFVVAAAIEFCDRTKARPSTGWGREFTLRVPVHDPRHWSSATVSRALCDALTFLTNDRWQICFVGRKMQEPSLSQGKFSFPDGPCTVMPFSDGLDSYVVAKLMERKLGHPLIRVRLGSKLQKRHRTQVPFAAVPYRVRCDKPRPVETSVRSRGFKFALISAIAAYLSQAQQIIVPESGQGVIGPALVPVGQAYKDYRCHPQFTGHMETFVLALFGHKVRYSYPRLWCTKGETLAEFLDRCPGDIGWKGTRSCWQQQRQVSVSRSFRQCGICAACLLRRMSIHAVGSSEDTKAYVWENLSTVRFAEGAAPAFKNKQPRGALHEYAIAGTLHLDHLANLLRSSANRTSLGQQNFQLSRSLKIPEKETRARLERLLGQHKEEWESFIESLGPKSFVTQWV